MTTSSRDNQSLFIAANWKMNGTKVDILALVRQIVSSDVIRNKPSTAPNTQVVLFPPFVYLQYVHEQIKNSPVQLGAQNLSQYDHNSAYTGEISANMLADQHCQYVLVGHSERRQFFGETNEIIAAKFQQAVRHQLIPILCVGETEAEYRQQKTQLVIQEQIASVIRAVGLPAFQRAIIAYEPVWAIGTGIAATASQVQEVHHHLRQWLAEKDREIAQNVLLLYGGSINASYAKELFEQPDVDGGLVGSASLDADQFLEICRSTPRACE